MDKTKLPNVQKSCLNDIVTSAIKRMQNTCIACIGRYQSSTRPRRRNSSTRCCSTPARNLRCSAACASWPWYTNSEPVVNESTSQRATARIGHGPPAFRSTGPPALCSIRRIASVVECSGGGGSGRADHGVVADSVGGVRARNHVGRLGVARGELERARPRILCGASVRRRGLVRGFGRAVLRALVAHQQPVRLRRFDHVVSTRIEGRRRNSEDARSCRSSGRARGVANRKWCCMRSAGGGPRAHGVSPPTRLQRMVKAGTQMRRA